MAIFLGVHKIPEGMTEDQVKEGWEKYKESAASKGIQAISVVVSLDKGFAYCQTVANSADQVREAHEVVEIPIEDVVEVEKLE